MKNINFERWGISESNPVEETLINRINDLLQSDLPQLINNLFAENFNDNQIHDFLQSPGTTTPKQICEMILKKGM